MNGLDRRALVSGAAAAMLAPWAAQTSSAWAASPVSGKQAPGFYRFKVGDFEITIINEGARSGPLRDGFVTNVGREQVLAAADSAYMPKGQVTVPFNAVAVNTGSKLVLIDTGYGSGVSPPVGMLTANLAAAGIDTKDIDVVLISHFHPDHMDGLKASSGGPAFPRAEIKVPSLDWSSYMSDESMSRAPEGRVRGYFENSRKVLQGLTDRVTPYEWGKEVAPGIAAVGTPGHTPGHTSFAISSGQGRLLVCRRKNSLRLAAPGSRSCGPPATRHRAAMPG